MQKLDVLTHVYWQTFNCYSDSSVETSGKCLLSYLFGDAKQGIWRQAAVKENLLVKIDTQGSGAAAETILSTWLLQTHSCKIDK